MPYPAYNLFCLNSNTHPQHPQPTLLTQTPPPNPTPATTQPHPKLKLKLMSVCMSEYAHPKLKWIVFIFDRQTGVILHQPLSLTIFRKKRENRRKMNGPPVYPGEKTENAPTWRPRKHNFRTPFSPVFPAPRWPPNPYQTPILIPTYYYYLNFISDKILNPIQIGKGQPRTSSHHHPNHTTHRIRHGYLFN